GGPVRVEGGGQPPQARLDVGRVGPGFDLDPHEEQAGAGVAELLRLGDVAAVVRQQAGDGVHDAGLVGAGERQDEVARGGAAGTVAGTVAVGGAIVAAVAGVLGDTVTVAVAGLGSVVAIGGRGRGGQDTRARRRTRVLRCPSRTEVETPWSWASSPTRCTRTSRRPAITSPPGACR